MVLVPRSSSWHGGRHGAQVTGANILFCDEPTSGLSSTDAEICIRLMRYSCLKRGISMFVVIHQPKPEVSPEPPPHLHRHPSPAPPP